MSLNYFAKYFLVFSIFPSLYFSVFPGQIVIPSTLAVIAILFGFLNVNFKNFTLLFHYLPFSLFYIYGVITFFRGVIYAEFSEDYFRLISSGIPIIFLLPLTIVFGLRVDTFIIILKFYLKYVLLLAILVFMLHNFYLINRANTFSFISFISPIWIFIFLLPYFNFKTKLLIIVFSMLSIFYDIGNRINMLNILFAYFIFILFCFKSFAIVPVFLKYLRVFLIVIPLLMIMAAFFYDFNVFKIGDYTSEIVIKGSGSQEQNLMVDSRSSIYSDVHDQLLKDNSYLFGLGMFGKTETSLVDTVWGNYDIIYANGRSVTESGMLNQLQYGGLIGAFLYFSLLSYSSVNAFTKSNNWFMKMVSVWLAYKLFTSFIEDQLALNIPTFFLFFCIGLCFNTDLLRMKDNDVKNMIIRNFKH